MAPFVQPLSPTNDPNYLNQSKGFSSPKPNATLSTLFSGITNAVEGLGPLEKGLVNDFIKKPLEDDLQGIVNSKGGDIAPEEAPAIAGTGGRGAKYAAASAAAGDLAAPDATDLTQDPAAPAAVKQGLNGLARMKAAFDQGELSETKFRAEVESAAKKYRTQYPEYADQVDSITSGYLGTSPANKVRESVLRDMISMSAAAGAGANKALAYVEKYQGPISVLYPDKSQAWAVQNIDTIKNNPKILALAARDQVYAWNKADWETTQGVPKKDMAPVLLRQEGDHIVQSIMEGAQNSSGVKFKDIVEKYNAGTLQNADPETIKQAVIDLQLVEDQAKQAVRARATARDPNDRKSQSYAQWMTPAEVDALVDNTVKPITVFREAISANRWDVASMAANLTKIRSDQDRNKLETLYPQLRSAGVLAKIAGNNPIPSQIFQQIMSGKDSNGNKDGLLDALTTGSWMNVKDTSDPKLPPTMSQQVEGAPKGVLSGSALARFQELHKTLLKDPDNAVAERAVHVLYGDTRTFDLLADNQKITMFAKLGDSTITERVKSMSPEAANKYYSFMEHAFIATSRKGMADLQAAITDPNVKSITLNPKTLQFHIEPTNPLRNKPDSSEPGSIMNSATGERRPEPTSPLQVAADRLNLSMHLYKPVLQDRYAGQEVSRLMYALSAAGVKFNEPKSPSIWARIGTAVQDALTLPEQPSAYGKPGKDSLPKPARMKGDDMAQLQQWLSIPENMQAVQQLKTLDPFNTKIKGKNQDRAPSGDPFRRPAG